MLGEQRREEDQPIERHELAKKEEAGKTGALSPAKQAQAGPGAAKQKDAQGSTSAAAKQKA